MIEEEYTEGLNAFLRREAGSNEVLKFGKAMLYYAEYIIPGVWAYREFKKPKEERSKLGVIGSAIYCASFVIKIGAGVAAVVLAHNGNSEKRDERYQDKKTNKTEIQEIKKENRLEKVLYLKRFNSY